MAQFEYRGVDIAVDHAGKFHGSVEDVRFEGITLAEAQGKIDKLKAATKKRMLALDVILLVAPHWGEAAVKRDVLTGINRTSRKLSYATTKDGGVTIRAFPATGRVEDAIERYRTTKEAYKKAEAALAELQITGPTGIGVIDPDKYESHLKAVERQYAEKSK